MQIYRVLPLLLLLFSSCGWHVGEGEFYQNYQTITVPFVDGDWQGIMTRSLVNQLATDSSFRLLNDGGDLTLLVKLKDVEEDNVGFRYDQKKSGKLIKYIIPTETRLSLLADVTLIDQTTGCALFGPVLFEANYDFDHDYYSARNSVNIFSLGQLTDYDEALEAALKPLYQELAKKIVDYIKSAW